MFRPARMERLSAVLLGSDARSVLLRLGALGAMEITEAVPGADTAPLPPPESAAALARCRSLLARASELRRALGVPPGGTPAGLENFAEAEAVLERFAAEAAAGIKRLETARADLARLSALRARLAAYSGLPLPSDKENLTFLYCATGSVPSSGLPGLMAGLSQAMLVFPLEEARGRRSLAALCARGSAAALEASLKAAGFQAESPAAVPGKNFSELGKLYAGEERAAAAELELAALAAQGLAGRAGSLLSGVEASAGEELRLLEAERCLPRTASAAFLSGWVPAGERDLVAEGLAGAAGGRCAVETAAAGEGAPVLLRPPGLLRAFAGLVSAYGLPGYGEVDPTAFAAFVYVLLFGAMFGDVGHGAVVCLAALFLMRLPKARFGDAALMMLCCGLASMFFGMVYGSCFGLEVFRKHALWRDPLGVDPFTLVLAALGAGAAVITLGLLLNIVNRVRLGDRLGAALGRFGGAGLLFYWCAILLLAGRIGPRLGLPALGAALACWIFKEPVLYLLRRDKGAGGSFGEVSAEAVVGAFEGALLYLANTISFARLAAYAMSHAALLAASFMLAAAADKVWGEGSLPGILAVIAGNLAAILLEGVVAAVQALRLEYYEFFGKFLEGDGRPFKPFVIGTGGIK